MSKLLLNLNGTSQEIPSSILALQGEFDFFISIEATGDLGTTNSSIQLMVYRKANRKVLMACNF